MPSYEQLVAEARAAPINGWNFSWLDGRATEERPSWGYSRLVAVRAAAAMRMLDLQSGGGELLGGLPVLPPVMVAVEAHPPNVRLAAARLAPRGGYVVAAREIGQALPFCDATFDLVTSRHPVDTGWTEIGRVLAPGGTYLSQQVGPHSMIDLSEFLLGPLPRGSKRDPELARRAAEAAGLEVIDLRSESLRTTFYDIGAVIYFLRLVVWIVPGFTVDRFAGRLRELHDRIQRDGAFEATATRFLIEATKPSSHR